MRFSRSKSPLTRFYVLCDQVLTEVDSAKYLGITITRELQWANQVATTANKGNSTLGFLRRNLKGCPHRLKETAYISLVRSVLEYSAAIWDPYLGKDIDALERIQRRAARLVKSDYKTTSSVTAMLSELGWKDLASRRRDLRLALMYKVVHDHIAVPVDQLNLTKQDSRTRASHGYTFRTQRANTNEYLNSFVPRTIKDWNRLPAAAVESGTTESFKTQLATVAWD